MTPPTKTKNSDDIAVVRLAETDSTQAELHRRLDASPDLDCTLIQADAQTAGRGRLGRTWQGAAGHTLMFSLWLPTTMPADRVPSISLAAGLTLRDWLRPWLATCLKWPNDVLGPDLKKLAGILSEAVGSSSGRIRGVVVGVGLNVSWPNGAPPDGLRTPAASLRDYGVDASFETLRATLPIWASGLRDWRDRLTGSGQAALADAYNAAMCAVKRPVRLKSFESDHSVGYIEGVSPAGKLRFRRADSGEIVDIESGELELQDTSVSMPAGD